MSSELPIIPSVTAENDAILQEQKLLDKNGFVSNKGLVAYLKAAGRKKLGDGRVFQTYELNDVIDNQVHCVIKGNQECYYPNNENLYLFNNQTKARKKFFNLLIEHEEWECGIENVQVEYNEEYFSFDDDEYEWGHCRTELIKIESEKK